MVGERGVGHQSLPNPGLDVGADCDNEMSVFAEVGHHLRGPRAEWASGVLRPTPNGDHVCSKDPPVEHQP